MKSNKTVSSVINCCYSFLCYYFLILVESIKKVYLNDFEFESIKKTYLVNKLYKGN